MPLHDWTRVSSLCFLDQHFVWTVALCNALNHGLLPPGYFALVQPDAVMVKRRVPPAQRIEIQHAEGRTLVAVVEMIAPAYKADGAMIEAFVKKSLATLKRGVHVTIVDVLPDPVELPGGFGQAITSRVAEAGAVCSAHPRPCAVGEAIPPLSLHLTATLFVTLPLEDAYLTAWAGFPKFLRDGLGGSAAGDSG